MLENFRANVLNQASANVKTIFIKKQKGADK